MADLSAKKFVDAKLLQRKVLLFSKTYSPECKAVKELLAAFKMPHTTFETVEIEARQDSNQIENYFQILCLTDSREVPQLFVQGKYIGGEKEVKRMFASGQLRKTLTEAEALA